MANNSVRVDNVAALCGVIWLILTIDACFTWLIPDILRDLIGTIVVIYGSILLICDHGIVISRRRRLIILSLMILSLHMILNRHNIFDFFIYFPLMLITIWRETTIVKFYVYFKNFVIFYAILSIIVELLVITRIWILLPHTILPPQDFVQESLGYVNYYYGFFCIPAEDTSLTFYRACGPLREGGHFIFFLGFVYYAEKVVYSKRNIWLIICGLLTLSPNFVILFSLTEGYCAIIQRRFLKPLLAIVGILTGAFVLFLVSPQTIQDEVIRIIFERMLEESLHNMDSEGVMAILNGRVGDIGLQSYENFAHSDSYTKLFGISHFDGDQLGSDFRWLLMYCGYIGTTLVLWCCFVFSYVRNNWLFVFCLFSFALAIFLQRAWMFSHVYIWTIMLLVTTINNVFAKREKLLCQSH